MHARPVPEHAGQCAPAHAAARNTLFPHLCGASCTQTASCEFLPPEHPHEVVTATTLGAHRAARSQAEQQRSGLPRAVRYEGIAAEHLNTADVVELLVRPVARATHLSYAAARVPRAHTGAPTHFASHAWGRTFGLLVEGLKAYFAGAVAEEVRPPVLGKHT